MLLRHLEGILNYCRAKVPQAVVEAANGNIKALLRCGRGYRNLNYLLLKANDRCYIFTSGAGKRSSGPSRFPHYHRRDYDGNERKSAKTGQLRNTHSEREVTLWLELATYVYCQLNISIFH